MGSKTGTSKTRSCCGYSGHGHGMQGTLLQRSLNDGLLLVLCIEPLLLDLAKFVRPRPHVPYPCNVNGCVWILGLSLLNDLALSRGSDHGALTTLMLGAETSVCSRFNINLILIHGFLLRFVTG